MTIVMLLATVTSGSAEIITSTALVLVFVLVTSPLSGHAIRASGLTSSSAPQQPAH